MAGVLSTANGQDPDDEKSNIQIDRNSIAQFGFKLVICMVNPHTGFTEISCGLLRMHSDVLSWMALR